MIELDEPKNEARITVVPGGALASETEQIGGSNNNIRWVVWALIAAVIAGLLVAGYVGWWYVGKIYPETEVVAEVDINVRNDDTVETLSERLYQRGLVSDPEVFVWYVERQGGLDITPGFYQLQSGEPMGGVLERLRTPPDQTYHRVTFPEGYTVDQMAVRLAEEDKRLTADKFRQAARAGSVRSKYAPPGQNSLEGLLFPDTYRISNADNVGQVLERMVGLMERVAAQEEMDTKSAELGFSPYQILTVASIIEREAKVDADRPKIARVIYNRLFLDMPLEIDATVYYGAPDFDGPFSELRQIDTPYNSYLHKGLPPTPISNPGRASIEAALNPIDNPTDRDPICKSIEPGAPCLYLFYVLADADGSHVFAATPEQHQANVAESAAKGLL